MAYPDVILAEPDLQSYWHLDEAAGNAIDQQGSIDGTYGGGVGRSRASLVPSYVDDACETFLADGGPVSFGDNYDFTGTAAFSAEIWVKFQSHPDTNEKYIMAKWDQGTNTGWKVTSNDTLMTFSRSQAGADDVFSDELTPGTAYHLVATYDGSTMQLYVNGSAVTGGTASSRSLSGHAINLAIGAYGGGGSACNAVLDEFAIYDAALSAATVLAHYQAGIGGSAVVAWIRA